MIRPSRSIVRPSRSEKVLGKDHPDVAVWYHNLAVVLKDQRKYDQAEPLFRRAMEIFQSKLGSDHPNTIAARENYDGLQQLKKQNSSKKRKSGKPAR
jgi:Tetratricopeptide repeat